MTEDAATEWVHLHLHKRHVTMGILGQPLRVAGPSTAMEGRHAPSANEEELATVVATPHPELARLPA